MKRAWKVLGTFVGLCAALFTALIVLGLAGLLFSAVLAAVAGWITFSFFHYRYTRQEELLHVLITAVESKTPVSDAVWAYLDDRPRSRWRELLFAFLLTPFYYWAWHRWNTFDCKVEHVATLLDDGASLHEALLETPGVASQDTLLAVTVGESSGKLAQCLQSVPRWRLATLWIEVVPRLVYPLLLLFVVMIINLFVQIFIVPKYEKIFADLHIKLPWITEQLIGFSRSIGRHAWILLLVLVAGVALIAGLLVSSRLCWYFPVLGRLYRMQARGRLLKALALLLQTDHTLPDALALLEESGYFSATVRRRLRMVRFRVALGDPFPEQLCQQGLLPRSMVPLVGAAQRADNLPWALGALGDSLSSRTMRLAQRLTLAIFPVSVVVVGVLVGFFALGMFSPLIAALTEIPT